MEQSKANKKVALLILDGWGYAPDWGGNAISIAKTPNYDKLWKDYPHTLLCASGGCVGLPGHERGNSEVGHLNLGVGRIPLQDSQRVNDAIEDGSFFKNPILLRAIDHCKKNNSSLHLMGLISEGNIHSHLNHLFALLDLCQQQNFRKVFIQAFTDGRDSEPMAALTFFSKLEKKIKQLGFGQVATISGRFYAMDRDDHWERIKKVYDAIVYGKGYTAKSPTLALSESYKNGYTDEYIPPINILENNKPFGLVKENDSVIFFNFRADRAREISTVFMSDNFSHFNREKISNLFYTGMIPYGYESELKLNLQSAFKTEELANPLASILSDGKMKQLHLAESEKYAHVTYFFNGGREKPFFGEERILIPSPRVSSFAQKPEMSAYQITEQLKFKLKYYDFAVVNFANGDMVGHTGDFNAAVKACEAVDKCLGEVAKTVLDLNYVLLLVADHGNCEEMVNVRTGEPNTEHTNNPVPFIMINHQGKLRTNGLLADISPTILEIMNIKLPKEFTQPSLLIKNK